MGNWVFQPWDGWHAGGRGITRRDAVTQHYVLFLSLTLRRDEENIRHASRPALYLPTRHHARWGEEAWQYLELGKKLSAGNTFILFLQLSYFNMLFLIINFPLLELKRIYTFLCLNSDTIKWISVKCRISSLQINFLKLRTYKTRVTAEVLNLATVLLLY